MSVSGQELLRRVREQINEVDPTEVLDLIGSPDVAIIDVRESEEVDAGPHPRRRARAAQLPRVAHRGHRRPTARKRVILYCAVRQPLRVRRQDAARRSSATSTSSRMTGGITLWKDRGYDVEVPAHAHARAARALLAPPAAPRGRRRGPAEAARRQGPAARRRRARLADRALPRRGRRRHARHRRRRRRRRLEPPAPGHPHDRAASACRRSTPPRRRSTTLNPDVEVVKYPTRLDASNIMEIIEGYDIDRRRRRQLPDALPAQRRDGAPADPGRLAPRSSASTASSRSSSRYEGPCYRCLFPAAAAGRAGAVLRRQRRARRAAGHDGPAAGDRGRQARSSASASRSSAACCCTTRSARRVTELKVRRDPECPICSRDPEDDRRRRAGRLPRLRGVLRRRRIGSAASWPPFDPTRPAPVRRRRARGQRRRRRPSATCSRALADAHPETAGPALRRRRRAQPLRQRLPQRRGRARARRARHGRRRRATRS